MCSSDLPIGGLPTAWVPLPPAAAAVAVAAPPPGQVPAPDAGQVVPGQAPPPGRGGALSPRLRIRPDRQRRVVALTDEQKAELARTLADEGAQ